MTIDPVAGTATVGAGLTQLEAVTALGDAGLAAPTGTEGSVGLAGATLANGLLPQFMFVTPDLVAAMHAEGKWVGCWCPNSEAELKHAIAMGADKARHVRDTGAEVLVAGDNSCLMHIGGMLSRQRAGVRVMHLAEILAATEHDEAESSGPAVGARAEGA